MFDSERDHPKELAGEVSTKRPGRSPSSSRTRLTTDPTGVFLFQEKSEDTQPTRFVKGPTVWSDRAEEEALDLNKFIRR